MPKIINQTLHCQRCGKVTPHVKSDVPFYRRCLVCQSIDLNLSEIIDCLIASLAPDV